MDVFLNSYIADHVVLTFEMTFHSMATATHQKTARLSCYFCQPITRAGSALGVAKKCPIDFRNVIAKALSGDAEQGYGSSSSSLIIRSVARIRGKTKERIGITLLV